MPELSRFYGIIITMNYRDHQPPHFHARYTHFEAEIGIRDGIIKAGQLPPKAKKLVEEWRLLHRKELMENWQRREMMLPMLPILPLE